VKAIFDRITDGKIFDRINTINGIFGGQGTTEFPNFPNHQRGRGFLDRINKINRIVGE
jgi:hypothetical protein